MALQARARPVESLRNPQNPLSGRADVNSIAKCGACGGSLLYLNKNPKSRLYYCERRHRRGRAACSNSRGGSMRLLEDFVRSSLHEMLADDERIFELTELLNERIERWNREHALKNGAREALAKEGSKLETAAARLTDAIESGQPVGDRLKQRQAERTAATAKLEATPLPRLTKRTLMDKIGTTIGPLVMGSATQVRECLRKLGVERIVVTPEGRGWRVEGCGDLGRLIQGGNKGTSDPSEPPPELVARAKARARAAVTLSRR